MVNLSAQQQMYGTGVASLIGDCGGISLDGQSVQIPGDTGSYMQDDISSIHESSYYRGSNNNMKIVGTASSMEEGNATGSPEEIAEKSEIERTYSSDTPVVEKGSTVKKPTTSSQGNKNSGRRSSCLPTWVVAAPKWLKCVIVVSVSMLVGAMVLVTVALSSALAAENQKSSGNAASGQIPPGTVVVNNPPVSQSESAPAPSPTRMSINEPTVSPVVDVMQEDWNGEPMEESIQGKDTDAPTEDTASSEPYDKDVTTFFVTGGRFTNDALVQLPEQLRTLPVRGGTSFMVHLGDWNSPYATQCDEQSYQDVDDLFSNSSIPVYFVTGDNDFNGMYSNEIDDHRYQAETITFSHCHAFHSLRLSKS